MAINLYPERVDPPSVRTNLRAIATHLDDAYYRLFIPAGAFVALGGAMHTDAGATRGHWPVLAFPASTDERVVASLARPRLWVTGRLRVTLWLSGDTASASVWRRQVALESIAAGVNLAAATSLLAAATVDQAGPAAIGDVVAVELLTTAEVSPRDALLRLSVAREGSAGADLYAGDAWLLAALVENVPATTEVPA